TSDRRLKTNIRPIEGLAIIDRLFGKRYQWTSTGQDDFGLIAQEVEAVLPEAVVTDSKTGYKAVKYSNLVAPLIEASKELHEMCKDDRRRIASLETENAKLKADVEELREQMRKIMEHLEGRLGGGK